MHLLPRLHSFFPQDAGSPSRLESPAKHTDTEGQPQALGWGPGLPLWLFLVMVREAPLPVGPRPGSSGSPMEVAVSAKSSGFTADSHQIAQTSGKQEGWEGAHGDGKAPKDPADRQREGFPSGIQGLSQGSHHWHALGRPEVRRSFMQGMRWGSSPSKEEVWSKGRVVF